MKLSQEELLNRNLKDITINKSNISSFRQFMKHTGFRPRHFVFYKKNKKDILESIKNYNKSVGTKKKILDVIKKIINVKYTNEKDRTELYNYYHNYYQVISSEDFKRRTENIIKDSEKEQYDKGFDFYKEKIPTENKYTQYELIYKIIFMTRFTPRTGDYPLLHYKSEDENHNSYDGEKFIWRHYKTHGKYGDNHFILEEELKNYLNDYIKHNDIKKGDLIFKSIRGKKQILDSKFGEQYVKKSILLYSGVENMTFNIIRKIKIKKFFIENKDIQSKSYKEQSDYISNSFMNSLLTIMIDYKKVN
jgi:hypothetical protein